MMGGRSGGETIRGDVPHGPERLIRTPIHLLSIIVYGTQDQA